MRMSGRERSRSLFWEVILLAKSRNSLGSLSPKEKGRTLRYGLFFQQKSRLPPSFHVDHGVAAHTRGHCTIIHDKLRLKWVQRSLS